jgi:UDP-N-acetylglucosamine 2-epimerase
VSRKICVVSGSRAEYGLLRWVMEAIRAAPDLRLQLIVTGTHLSPEFGLTYREIERDGFHIDRQVEMLLSSDTAVGIAKSMGLGLIGFGEALQQLQPDLLLVLGDRFSRPPPLLWSSKFRSPTCTAERPRRARSMRRCAIRSPRWHSCISSQRRNTAGAWCS